MDEEETWTALDTAMAKIEAAGTEHPLLTAMLFVTTLEDEESDPQELRDLVTPESAEFWGDFDAARRMLKSIEKPGYGTTINRAPGAVDVGYFKILENVEESFEVHVETAVLVPAVVTIIWRPEKGKWLVHQFGAPAEPEELSHVRTSPGEAPSY